jgi:hypothetical protein
MSVMLRFESAYLCGRQPARGCYAAAMCCVPVRRAFACRERERTLMGTAKLHMLVRRRIRRVESRKRRVN